ncbi:MAG TPA: hypothetical protein P5121_37725 [Caldilineaceae bacterium]|nr:hypothetical protein [Caldilineaceae bacterium]
MQRGPPGGTRRAVGTACAAKGMGQDKCTKSEQVSGSGQVLVLATDHAHRHYQANPE